MMNGRYLWVEGELDILPGFGKTHHKQMLQRMKEEGRVRARPENYVGGVFSKDKFHEDLPVSVGVEWSAGEHPTPEELGPMIAMEIERFGREQGVRARVAATLAATSEDTEAMGENVGFLADPHDTKYPPLFRGEPRIPIDVSKRLKAHVLNALEEDFEDPDRFIYFTIYGSGLGYNWDEGGDLDIQMWVDIEKFQQLNEGAATMTMDDLIAAVRRRVQTVNFPSFKDLGLYVPQDAPESVEGTMLIQYYPKPGKGTPEENLASQPYACYDLETDEWIVEPEPITPTFYGQHFVDLMPKAEDMAIQAEALISEFERNVLNWQFWFSLYSRYRNPVYFEQYQQSMQDATMEKEGIKTMFEGIFGGRAKAYSPEGEGIKDERDMVQKLLEVWGIFQRLKHYARAPLPWEEQELPGAPEKTAGWKLAQNPIQAILDAYDGDRLQDYPGPVNVPGYGRLDFGSHAELQDLATTYGDYAPFEYAPPRVYAPVDPDRAARIAEEYERMEHRPDDPDVKASYDAFIKETMEQYNLLLRSGYTFEFYPEEDPYPNGPREAILDLYANKHLYVYPTSAGFGHTDQPNHPLLGDSGVEWNGQPVTYNDIFRAVHDVFGHAKEGVGFRADGEENAWRQHAAMYSDLARPAMTAETRGQNSWVNFGPHGQTNQKADQMSTVYAEQKAGIMPEWTMQEGLDDSQFAARPGGIGTFSMADRSGHPEIDALIEEFLQQPLGDYTTDMTTIEALRDPQMAHGMCDAVTEQFVEFAKAKGFKAYVTQTDLEEMGYTPMGEGGEIGFDENDEMQYGFYPEHTIATIVLPGTGYGREVYVDFTATQYGYTDHPKVTSKVAAEGSPEHDDPGGWAGIMQKAQRLRQNGQVQVMRNGVQNIVGIVQGDHGTYTTEIWRDDPGRGTITLWNCECPWNDYSWGRTRQFKKYEGRPCAHTLALYWEAATMPMDAEQGEPEQMQIPGQDWNPGPAIQQTLPNQQQQPAVSELTTQAPDPNEPLAMPGTFSSWRKSSMFENGDYVRAIERVDGYDEDGVYYVVPRNMIGEVIWADEEEAIVIFSIESKALGPHNVRVIAEPEKFRLVPRDRGTAPRRRR